MTMSDRAMTTEPTMIRRMDQATEVGGDLPPMWEVDMAAFRFSLLALERHEVVALAEWLDDVCGGSNDQAETLRAAVA